ncbi:MAG: HAMP domain-containing histidine kinase [Planctomycetes bacterium]|nr:HAMP domain-containing histidine kinase [Planctomycetota bacterium]MBL7037895.1 HAMP domain-containing histidine kinase [Pirellulaceae bacterium]
MSTRAVAEFARKYVLDTAPVLFLRMDSEGCILEASQYAIDLMGEDTCEQTFSDVLVDFGGKLRLADLTADASQRHMLDVATKAGLPQTFYFRFFTHEDQVLCFGAKDAEDEERLRTEVLSLNHELSNLTRDLQKSNAELARLNELKNQFLGMAAHDLRKPVGLVMAYSEFVLDEAGDALSHEHREFLSTILSSSGSMKRLIDDFLDVAIIESGRLALEIEPTEFGPIVQRAFAVAGLAAKKKRIALTVDQDGAVPPLLIDGPKIEQALGNLLSNAIEHSHPDATVEVRTRREGELVTVSVKDEGDGIAEEELSQLFQPYERTGTQKTADERSTGLGLAIALRIVEEHGGKIEVESTVGVGSTFRIWLPLAS